MQEILLSNKTFMKVYKTKPEKLNSSIYEKNLFDLH